ncbi:hypothetical protein Q7P37_002090 [Cladosporium fusiforme]
MARNLDLQEYHNSKMHADAIVRTHDGSVQLYAHKVVLSAGSAHFRHYFEEVQNDNVKFDPDDPLHVKVLLLYCARPSFQAHSLTNPCKSVYTASINTISSFGLESALEWLHGIDPFQGKMRKTVMDAWDCDKNMTSGWPDSRSSVSMTPDDFQAEVNDLKTCITIHEAADYLEILSLRDRTKEAVTRLLENSATVEEAVVQLCSIYKSPVSFSSSVSDVVGSFCHQKLRGLKEEPTFRTAISVYPELAKAVFDAVVANDRGTSGLQSAVSVDALMLLFRLYQYSVFLCDCVGEVRGSIDIASNGADETNQSLPKKAEPTKAEPIKLYAHRLVLATGSGVFSRWLEQKNHIRDSEINVRSLFKTSLRPGSIEMAVKYLYGVPILPEEQSWDTGDLVKLCYVAEVLEISGLYAYAAPLLERYLEEMILKSETEAVEDEHSEVDIFIFLDEVSDIIISQENEGRALLTTDVAMKLCCKHYSLIRKHEYFSDFMELAPNFWELLVDYIARQREGSLL